MRTLNERTTGSILQEIQSLQYIQQTHKPTSAEWKWASRELAPLFAEMARREQCAS